MWKAIATFTHKGYTATFFQHLRAEEYKYEYTNKDGKVKVNKGFVTQETAKEAFMRSIGNKQF